MNLFCQNSKQIYIVCWKKNSKILFKYILTDLAPTLVRFSSFRSIMNSKSTCEIVLLKTLICFTSRLMIKSSSRDKQITSSVDIVETLVAPYLKLKIRSISTEFEIKILFYLSTNFNNFFRIKCSSEVINLLKRSTSEKLSEYRPYFFFTSVINLWGTF